MDKQFAANTLEAVEEIIASALNISPTVLRDAAAARRSKLSLEFNRVLSSGAFGDSGGYFAAAALETESDSASQFGYDLSLLCLFSQLADARLERADAAFSQRLGDRLLMAVEPSSAAATRESAPLVALGVWVEVL